MFIPDPIHPDFEAYAEMHTSAPNDYLYELYRETHLKTMYPRMIAGRQQGKFLEMISRLVKPNRILEIGTFTGYSTICLASGLIQDGLIHTIDTNPESVAIGRKYFTKTGLKNKIVMHCGNAMEIIPHISDIFDIVYIDADKENYLNYYNLVFDKVKPGGLIMADNVFWNGKVLEWESADQEAKGIIRFNTFVQNDERVDNILITIRDGLMMVLKK